MYLDSANARGSKLPAAWQIAVWLILTLLRSTRTCGIREGGENQALRRDGYGEGPRVERTGNLLLPPRQEPGGNFRVCRRSSPVSGRGRRGGQRLRHGFRRHRASYRVLGGVLRVRGNCQDEQTIAQQNQPPPTAGPRMIGIDASGRFMARVVLPASFVRIVFVVIPFRIIRLFLSPCNRLARDSDAIVIDRSVRRARTRRLPCWQVFCDSDGALNKDGAGSSGGAEARALMGWTFSRDYNS